MKVLGIVQWTNRDKLGHPIAGVLPLVEIQQSDWRSIDPAEEFPSQGQVFWPNAQAARVGLLITFRTEPNPGQKDEYKVTDARAALEVFDLRQYGHPTQVRAALSIGIPQPGPTGTLRVLVWCQPDVLVGPIELVRLSDGTLRLTGANLARVPTFNGARLERVRINKEERLVRADEGPPSGYVDWDDDETVLRRAVEAAVRLARHDGYNSGQTKRQIEEAVRLLAARGIGAETQLDRYRLERALSLCADQEALSLLATNLLDPLLEHPSVRAKLDKLCATTRAELEQSTRKELEQRLVREQAALAEALEAHASKLCELEVAQRELDEQKRALEGFQRQSERASAEAEAAERQAEQWKRELDDLRMRKEKAELEIEEAERRLGLLRKEFEAVGPNAVDVGRFGPVDRRRHAQFHRRGENLADRVALQRALTHAARKWGIDPSIMLHLHATVVARLVPVAIGPSALALMTAYAHAVCGGRISVLHVSPDVIQPRDLEGNSGSGLNALTEAAKDIDGISIIVLEGANRCPLESSLVPILQLSDLTDTHISSTPNVRLGATLVAGATTVPVSSQLWSHAVAIYPEPISLASQLESPASDLALSSDLLATGDVPIEEVESLVDKWPDCRDLRPALARFGAGLSRFCTGERIGNALLHGIILPYVLTALPPAEREDAINSAGPLDDSVAAELRRLRARIC